MQRLDTSWNASPLRLTMPFVTPGQVAFSALQFLPVPVLVLNSFKTVVLANESMGRLLGLVTENSNFDETASALEGLRGQSLSQVGIDLIQNGKLVWIAWETFLESVCDEMGSNHASKSAHYLSDPAYGDGGDMTPTAGPTGDRDASARQPGPHQQAVVDVVISRKDLGKTAFDTHHKSNVSGSQTYAKMITTIWDIEDNEETYFTLTFTNSEAPVPTVPASKKRSVARPNLDAAEKKTIQTASKPSPVSSSHDSSTSSPSYHSYASPSSISLSSSPFPPNGPPSKFSSRSAPSILQKHMVIKDALLDNTEMPILAMWRDGSVSVPNGKYATANYHKICSQHPLTKLVAAARKILRAEPEVDRTTEGMASLRNWALYTPDFKTPLNPEEYPIAVLVRTQTPFTGFRIGVIDQEGKKIVYDVLGEAIRDDETGEFLAGVVTCKDVTEFTQEIDEIKRRNEERFQLTCDTMPQLVSTS